MEFTRKVQNLKKGLLRFGRLLTGRGRRFCAMLLCASMVMSGFPSTFFQAFASNGSDEYCYGLERESLADALLTAVSEGTVLEKEPDLTGEYADQYRELLEADGTLYELKDLKAEKLKERDKVLDLRVFARIKDDIPLDAEYEISGDETLIFLLINRSKDEVSAVIRVDDQESETIKLVPASSVSKEEGPGSARSEAEPAPAPEVSYGSEAGSKKDSGADITEEPSEDNKKEASEDTDNEASNDDKDDTDASGTDPGIDNGSYTGSDSDTGSGREGTSETDTGSGKDNTSDPDTDSDPSRDTGSRPGTDSSSDTGSDSGSGSGGNDSDGKEGSGDKDAKDDSDSRDHSDRNDASGDKDHTEKSDTKTASLSSHGGSLLALPLTEIVIEAGGTEEITIASISDMEPAADEPNLSDTPVKIVGLENAINGDLYDAVLLGGKKAAVAFVTTTEELGLGGYTDLSEQTIEAKIYSDSAYDKRLADGTSITLTGMMPAGALAKAYPVDVEIEDVRILAAYDITIFNKNGREFQPKDDVIEVIIENDAIHEALENDHELTVYHMEDEDDEPEEIAVIEPAPKRLQTLAFPAEKFSIYVVGDDGTLDGNIRYTVNFHEYVFDEQSQTGTILETQYAFADDFLTEPSVPEIDNHVFDGWFTEEQDGAHWDDGKYPGYKYDFSKTVYENLESWQEYEPKDDHVIDLYSDYDPIYYVYYMTEESGAEPVVFFTDEYHENNSQLDTSRAENVYQTSHLKADQAVTVWYYYDEGGAVTYIDNPFEVTKDLVLYPVVESVVWIYFQMGEEAGQNVEAEDPIYVTKGVHEIGALPEPENPGYSFAGWYIHTEDESTHEVVSRLVTADSDPSELLLLDEETNTEYILLYAHWDAAPVSYTINIWRQKATDGKKGLTDKEVVQGEKFEDYIDYYDFAESIHIAAGEGGLKTGETPVTSRIPGWSTYTGYGTIKDNGSAYYGFECGGSTSAATRTLNELGTVTMAADGSTVINIYYNRVTVTWHFGTSSKPDSTGTLIGLYGTNVATADPGGTLYDWPDPPAGSNRWYHNSVNTTFEATFVIIDSSVTISFVGHSVTEGGYGYYYLEITDEDQLDAAKEAEAAGYGVPYIREVNDTRYRYVRRITRGTGEFDITDKYTGYQAVGYTTIRKGYTDTSTKYTDASEGDAIQAQIFSGLSWHYADFYLFHDARTYSITLISNGVNVGIDKNTGEQKDNGNDPTYTFKYGESLKSTIFPDTLDPDIFGPNYYYRFTGDWYEDPGITAPFVRPDNMPANNLVAYAGWELATVTVTFQSAVGSDLYSLLTGLYEEVEVISEPDEDNPDAPCIYQITITAGQQLEYDLDDGLTSTDEEHDYKFGGWMYTDPDTVNESIFNFESHIYKDTVLRAFWTEEETEYHIEYNINIAGYPGESAILGHPHESTSWAEVRELKDEDLFGESISDEGFICWNTEPDGSGLSFYPGEYIDFTGVPTEAVYKEGDAGTGELLYYVFRLYAIWEETNEVSLILDYNYPDDYIDENNPEGRKEVTGKRLSDIDLGDESGLDITITVPASSEYGDTVYWLVGWSEDKAAKPGDDGIIPVTAAVAVTENETAEGEEERSNILYAVWEPVKKADLAGDTEYDGEPAFTGDEITYAITYVNYTDETATVTITDTLDTGLDFISAAPDGTYVESTDAEGHTVITWTIADVEAGALGSVTLTAMVNGNATGGMIKNVAAVTVGNEDKVTGEADIPVISGRELPETGGPGTLPFTAGGLLMLGGAALILLTLRRRKVRVGE